MDERPNQGRISVEQVRRRITNVLGRRPLTGVPRKETDKLCLLLALAGAFSQGRSYGEPDVNSLIQRWLVEYDQEGVVDHVMLRRLLVDFQFMARSQDGQTYQLNAGGPGFLAFEAEALALDVDELIRKERREAEARRTQFTQDG